MNILMDDKFDTVCTVNFTAPLLHCRLCRVNRFLSFSCRHQSPETTLLSSLSAWIDSVPWETGQPVRWALNPCSFRSSCLDVCSSLSCIYCYPVVCGYNTFMPTRNGMRGVPERGPDEAVACCRCVTETVCLLPLCVGVLCAVLCCAVVRWAFREDATSLHRTHCASATGE